MATLYRKLKKYNVLETKLIALLMIVSAGFGVWLPYVFAGLTPLGGVPTVP